MGVFYSCIHFIHFILKGLYVCTKNNATFAWSNLLKNRFISNGYNLALQDNDTKVRDRVLYILTRSVYIQI